MNNEEDIWNDFFESKLLNETENKITQFINSKSKLEPNCYHEKSILKWFSLNEIKNSNSKILYRLRQMILKKF